MEEVAESDEGALCSGCLRTLPEIAAWGTATDEVKAEIWRRIATRRRKMFETKG
jgi:predicted Fe-S protein YdhL (DUF1289 family)